MVERRRNTMGQFVKEKQSFLKLAQMFFQDLMIKDKSFFIEAILICIFAGIANIISKLQQIIELLQIKK